ncbi:MAG TPA: hypothetical protein VKG05_03255 [Steroidobacteraceae bacterium]|nr:hypothetical protein [Steroidobacteraceae bacterium]
MQAKATVIDATRAVVASSGPVPGQAPKLVSALAALSLVFVTGLVDRVVAAPISNSARSTGHRLVAKPRRLSPEAKPVLDRSGRKRFGNASFYAKMFAGRTMADGTSRRRPPEKSGSIDVPG